MPGKLKGAAEKMRRAILVVRDFCRRSLTAQSSQLLLFIQQIHLTRATVHKQLNHGPRLRLMMRPPGDHGI
jgi:predicted metal-dependent hydrolase